MLTDIGIAPGNWTVDTLYQNLTTRGFSNNESWFLARAFPQNSTYWLPDGSGNYWAQVSPGFMNEGSRPGTTTPPTGGTTTPPGGGTTDIPSGGTTTPTTPGAGCLPTLMLFGMLASLFGLLAVLMR